MTVAPVLFLIGTESYLKRRTIEDVRKELFPKGSGGLNDDTMDLSDRGVSEVIDLANTIPMLAARRLIVARNGDSPKEEDQEKWIAYLENPSKSAAIIVLADKLDKRSRLFKSLEKAKAWVECSPPKPREVATWVIRFADRWNVKISAGAREQLVEAVGPDLARLDREIEKLALFVHPATEVPESAVRSLVGRAPSETVFRWTDAVIEGKVAVALGALDDLVTSGDAPIALVGMLARHLRILIRARYVMRARTPRPEWAGFLGVPPFLIDRYMEQARGWSDAALRKAFGELQRMDQALKSTGQPGAMLLEETTRRLGRFAKETRV